MLPDTIKVALTADVPIRNPEFLCPGRTLRWGRCNFVYNPPSGEPCDFWIVTAGAPPLTRMVCAPENTLFATGEPPAKKSYPRKFYAQFHQVVSANPADPHPRVIPSLLPLNWLVGFDAATGKFRYGYDELAKQTPPAKSLRLSAVCSSLRATAGQRLRLDFLERLKQRLGDRVVHFGRGFTPISDKMEAIAPYHYHLALENSTHNDYWTEKLADAYLGWAFPLYVGCPNLDKYFPTTAFTRIDPNNFERAAQQIEKIIATPPSLATQEAIKVSRDKILNEYNLFALLAGWVEKLYQPGRPPKLITVRSHKAFRSFPRGLIFRWRNRNGRS